MRWGINAVLLDDDILIQKAWAVSAKNARVTLGCFFDKTSLLSALANMERRTDVFLEGKPGSEDTAKELFNLGFRNIFIETKLSSETLPKCHWIKGVLGKDPPWGA